MDSLRLPQLREQLAQYFDLSELKILCFELDIKYENLPGETIDNKTHELISYCVRHGQIYELLSRCRKLRPNIKWPWNLELDRDDIFYEYPNYKERYNETIELASRKNFLIVPNNIFWEFLLLKSDNDSFSDFVSFKFYDGPARVHHPNTNIALVRPHAYDSIGSLLDDMHYYLVKNVFPPFTYGEKWVLMSHLGWIIVPWLWNSRPNSVSRNFPTWFSSTKLAELGIVPKTDFFIQDMSNITKTALIASKSKDLIQQIKHPKTLLVIMDRGKKYKLCPVNKFKKDEYPNVQVIDCSSYELHFTAVFGITNNDIVILEP